MAESAEQVLVKLRDSVEPGYRGRLTARGLARSMVWKDGVLPPENERLGVNLSQELLSYGYGLLRLALRAKELEIADPVVLRAFELAATSLEGVVKNGDPTDEARGFYRVTAAAAYHLGRFSARAFSLLSQSLSDANISAIEKGLSLLILRRLDDLYDLALSYLQDQAHSDDALLERLSDLQDDFDLDDVLVVSLTENYLRALASFVYTIRTGDTAGLLMAQERLRDGESFSSQKGFVPIWWVYRLTKFLLHDLWQQSLQQLLPRESNDGSRWPELREEFLALLASKKTAELELWPSQVEIASRVLDEKDDIVASLPTSAGKTRIAELCILRTLSNQKRVVFITPLRSLSAQTERSLRQNFSPLGFEVSALYGSSGSSAFDTDSLANRPIVVSTPEKLDFALRNNPSLLDDVGLVILDEGHMLGPSEREVRYEVLIQRLLRRPDVSSRRIVCLSAMLPDGNDMQDFVSWIRADEPGEPIRSDWRPTRQNYGEVTWQSNYASFNLRVQEEESFVPRFVEKQRLVGPRGGAKEFPSSQKDLAIASAWRLVAEGHSVLVFCPQADYVEAIAKRVLEATKLGFLSQLPFEDRIEIQKALDVGKEWLGPEHEAIKCLSLGVMIHYASLPRPFLRELDLLLQRKKIKLVVASPTLSQGLNLSASCVLFRSVSRYSTERKKRELISAEDFANVAGRAGRAFVDVDGQVLGVCFTRKEEAEWRQMLDQHTERKLDSGLIQIVVKLFISFRHKLPADQDSVEFILNNSLVWERPETNEDAEKAWERDVAILDTALLSLIGDQSCGVDEIATALDSVLTASFLRKRLQRKPENQQQLVLAVLESRAKHIWANSSQKQRKGYFFAGLGLKSGRFLDDHSIQLNEAVLQAETAFRVKNAELCIEGLLSVAQIVFSVDPFIPNKFPDEWQKIFVGWLRGDEMANLQKLSKDAARFVEDGLVYRLVWALEAIRARSRANEEQIFDDHPSPLASVIEAGTMNVSVATLVQAGLQSRTAAIKAIEDFPESFEILSDMRQWLFSEAIVEATNADDWPTKETSLIWKSFVNAQRRLLVSKKRKGIERPFLRITYDAEFPPLATGSSVVILNSGNDKESVVYTPDLLRVGTVRLNPVVGTRVWVAGNISDWSTVKISSEKVLSEFE